MKKIVFVIGSLENGGAERVVSVLTNFLAEKNEVHIVTTMEDKIDYEINDKVTYKYIMDDYENEQGIKRNFLRIFALRNYFNTIKPDVIISFLWATNIVSILVVYKVSICLAWVVVPLTFVKIFITISFSLINGYVSLYYGGCRGCL